ncbi:MAG: hypothetical protein ABI461_18215 [Polyangiaceae bacterium]
MVIASLVPACSIFVSLDDLSGGAAEAAPSVEASTDAANDSPALDAATDAGTDAANRAATS